MSGTIHTGLNGVPEDWELTSFGKCAEIVAGQSPKGETYNTGGEGMPLLNGPAEFGARTPTAAQWTSKPTKFAQKDDVLFCVRGNTTGRMNVADGEYCIGRGLAAIRQVEGKTTTPFVYFLLCLLRPSIYAIATAGGSTFPNISKSTLSEFEVGLPPLPEQKRIAHILSTVQRAIEAQERIIQTTTELKKALMHKLFTEGLRNEPQKQTEIGPVPESWETATVASVCTIKASAMSYKQLENAPNLPDGIRVIGIKVSDMNLPGNEIEFRFANLERQLPEKEALKRTVPANSIIFPKRGAAIATNKKRLTTGRTVLDPNLIAVMPTKSVNHRYLFHWFNTFDLKKITDPGPTPQLNKKDIAPLKFPMPSIEEQLAIAAAVDATEGKITLHRRKREQLQDLYRALLHNLMTAKTRVRDLKLPA
jgi:type I restriction enzyme S subunit